MANVTTKDIEAAILEVLDPQVQKILVGPHSQPINSRGYRIPYTQPDLHPWLTDARAMLRMLNGDIDIPHPMIKRDKYGMICEHCSKAEFQRLNYKMHLLSTESGQQ